MNSGWLLPILLLLWLIWRVVHQRDLALAFVRRWCAREHLQLLDDNLSFMGWRRWPVRVGNTATGTALTAWLQRLRLVQQFRFEISADGRERRQGRLLMCGKRILRLQIETADGHQLIETTAGNAQVS